MVDNAPVFFGAIFLLLLSLSSPAPCKKEDLKQLMLQCDHNPKTRTRSLVYYLNANCSGGVPHPAPIHGIPCDCPPGKGLSRKLDSNSKCLPCSKGQYGAGGEIINDWALWTNNGSTPPEESGIITFCQLSHNHVYTCQPWKASADNLTVDSGENAMSRCLTSVLMITKKFVVPDSRVSFDYRVDGRKCRHPTFLMGCDGLGFFIDDKQVVNYTGSVFFWSTVTFNLTTGMHTLKWIYRKTCFSFPSPSFMDRAFIRSITLVGTAEPNVTCIQCSPGYYGDQIGSSSCKPCPYFHHQPQKGQSKCEPCPPDTFSLLGAANCLPLPNCTDDDIIAAPGNLSTCSVAPNGSIVTTVHPEYINVQGLPGKALCKPVDSKPLLPSFVLCSCQPGFKIYKDGDRIMCQPCDKGSYSEGLECTQCPKGHVALPGKHFHLWQYRTLPEGFSTNCVGDCGIEGGWISAGNLIRTGRVIGNVDSYLQTPMFVVDSPLAKVAFSCSVTCVVSGIPKKGKPPRGENLANIQDCNLVFEMYVNDSLVDQMNCTSPKGLHVYRHDNRRDGEIVHHMYPLKKANYSFRWVFHQVDETRSLSAAFEGKIYNISVLGVSGGEASNCTPCPPGYRSVFGNTDCAICPVGTASPAGSDTCHRCGEGHFAPKEGSETCLRCGNNTKPTKNKDGCDSNNCKFSPAPGVEYDLRQLSRPGGPMIEILTYQPLFKRRPGFGMSGLSVWPVKPSFYVNLCTLEHDNTSCTYLDPTTRLKKSLPVMACRTSWWSSDISVGTVIGYSAKTDVRSGLMVELLHGDRCYRGKGHSNYSTTLDLVCDVKAGVGNPGPENNYTDIMRGSCRYYFVWRSLYACPKCRKVDVTAIYSDCVNGTRNITYVRSLPCFGFGDDGDITAPKTEECVVPTETVTVVVVNTTVSYLVKESSKVNKILIGVGVVVIVALLAVAGLFVYKHRTMKYRYYTLMARNKPMSRLEKEEDENSFFGDQEPDPFDSTTAPVRT